MSKTTIGNASTGSTDNAKRFIFDSGASHHICSCIEYFHNLKTVDEFEATLGDDSTIKGNKVRKVDFVLQNVNSSRQEGVWLRLTNVLYLEKVGLSLLSMSAFDEHNTHASFKKGDCFLIDGDNGKHIGKGFKCRDGFFQLLGSVRRRSLSVKCNSSRIAQINDMDLNIRHQRLDALTLTSSGIY